MLLVSFVFVLLKFLLKDWLTDYAFPFVSGFFYELFKSNFIKYLAFFLKNIHNIFQVITMLIKPLLTIAIPVFNGAKNIHLTLDSIFTSSILNEDIEVLVSDNASIDATSHILTKYQNRFPLHMRLIRNAINIGYDGNIDELVHQAKGDYVWFVGSGERVIPGAISYLIKSISQDNYDTVVVNFDTFNESSQSLDPSPSYPDTGDQIITDRNDFTFPRYCPAVSGNIVRRDKWVLISGKPLHEIGWCHIERMLYIIGSSSFNKSLFISSKCFTLFRDVDGWFNKSNSYELLLKHIAIIKTMNDRGFSREISNRLEKKLSKYALLLAVLQSKSHGLRLTKDLIFRFIGIFGRQYFFWVAILPALFMPQLTAIYILKFNSRFNGRMKC